MTHPNVARAQAGLPELPHELDPDTILAAIKACVTVVRPGEVLVVKVPERWTADRFARAFQDAQALRDETGVHITFVPGEEFAVVTARPQPLQFARGGVIARAPGEKP